MLCHVSLLGENLYTTVVPSTCYRRQRNCVVMMAGETSQISLGMLSFSPVHSFGGSGIGWSSDRFVHVNKSTLPISISPGPIMTFEPGCLTPSSTLQLSRGPAAPLVHILQTWF